MPSPILAVWVGEGGIDWSKIAVPAGIRVVDERAIGHGYTIEDGAVVTGTVYDMASSKPVVLNLRSSLPESRNDAHDEVQDVTHVTEDDSLSIEKKERELITRALRKNNNKRKYAARDLGISERTLYRKIKEYHLEE